MTRIYVPITSWVWATQSRIAKVLAPQPVRLRFFLTHDMAEEYILAKIKAKISLTNNHFANETQILYFSTY